LLRISRVCTPFLGKSGVIRPNHSEPAEREKKKTPCASSLSLCLRSLATMSGTSRQPSSPIEASTPYRAQERYEWVSGDVRGRESKLPASVVKSLAKDGGWAPSLTVTVLGWSSVPLTRGYATLP
ncbi:hypothetical protein CR513_59497, partial [Mucuna pruriens]